MPSLVYVIAGVWVAIILVRYIVGTVLLLKVELKRPQVFSADIDQMSPGTASLLARAGAELEALGFIPSGYVGHEQIQVLPNFDPPEYQLVLIHAIDPAYAFVRIHEDGLPIEPVRITFVTRFQDDHQLTTVNAFAHVLFAITPKETVVDPFALDLQSQWFAHRQAIRERRVEALRPDEDILRFCRDMIDRDLDRALEHGELRRSIGSDGERYGYSFWPALKAVVRLSSASSKMRRHRKALAQGSSAVTPLPLDVQLYLYRRVRAFQAKRSRRGVLAVIFALSAGLTLFSFIPQSGGLAGAAILLGVVLFHELGHFAAMRAFGFKDTSIFFLPFFGGAALGAKEGATPAEEILVLFAGPAPGLILGLILAAMNLGGLWQQTALMLIAVNALNLLPIFPLDGGRIARTVLFARSIALDVAFQILAAGIAFAAAAYLDVWILALPGVFTLMGLPRVIRTAQLAKNVGREGPRDLEVLRAIDQALPPAAGSGERFGLAKMIEQKMAAVPLSIAGSLVWGSVYAAILAGAVTGSVFAVRSLAASRPSLFEIYDRFPGRDPTYVTGTCADLTWIDAELTPPAKSRAIALYTCVNARARSVSFDPRATNAAILDSDLLAGDFIGYVELPFGDDDAKSAAQEVCRMGCDELQLQMKTLDSPH